MRKLKIAIFSGTIPSTTFIESLISGVSLNHEVILFGIRTKTIQYSRQVHQYITPKNKWINFTVTCYRSLLLLIKRPKELFKLIRVVQAYRSRYERWIWFSKFLPIVLYRPDIFHMQWARDIEFYMFLKTQFSIPIIISLRGAHINYTPIIKSRIAEIYREYFPQVNAFHAVSEAIAKEAQKYGVRTSSIQVIHSPIKKEVYDCFIKEKYHIRPEKGIKLISVGRFHWKKGYVYGLRAIRILRDKGFKVTYTIVSTNALPEALQFQIHQQDLKDYVHIVKGMSHNELLTYLRGFDLMLLPSIEEGIANVVLEAMAMGLLVVSADCGGMAEVVKNGKTGWLVPIRDPEAIALAVEDFLKTEGQKLNQMALEAHNLIKKEFEAEDVIAQFETMYQSIDKNNKRG